MEKNKMVPGIKSLPVIFAVVFLSSCISYYFEHPVPYDAKTVNEMPKILIGEWQGDGGKLIVNNNQWISVETDSNGITVSKIEYALSDSLIIKRDDKRYFFNELNSNGFWSVYLGCQSDNLFLIKRLAKADSLIFKNSIGLLPDSVSGNDFYYGGKLTKQAMQKFVDDGGFSDTLFKFNLKTRTVNQPNF